MSRMSVSPLLLLLVALTPVLERNNEKSVIPFPQAFGQDLRAFEQAANTWVKRSPLPETPPSPQLGYEGACVWDNVHHVLLRYGGTTKAGAENRGLNYGSSIFPRRLGRSRSQTRLRRGCAVRHSMCLILCGVSISGFLPSVEIMAGNGGGRFI